VGGSIQKTVKILGCVQKTVGRSNPTKPYRKLISWYLWLQLLKI